MSGRAQARILPDGRRLHLQDGPIDLLIEGFGPTEAVAEGFRGAAAAFEGLLDELCEELPLLRARALPDAPVPRGPVARSMARAVAPFVTGTFITPMAAVAGAVADHILAALVRDPAISRAYVNNGGDIALHVAPEERLTIGLIDRPDRPSLLGRVAVEGGDGIGGIATSGWRGRSFSLGIAESVTVLAHSAAEADAAATVIANAVDLPGHPAIIRIPADRLAPDSDLGSRLVTRNVGPLTEGEITDALDAGLACAEELQSRGLILGAALQLQGRVATTTGRLPSPWRRGVKGEGSQRRARRFPSGCDPYAQHPSPPAPLHKSGSEPHDRHRAPAIFRSNSPEPHMPDVAIRKRLISVEEIFHERGPVSAHPPRRASIVSVIRNPFAGRYVAEIQPFMKDLEPLGLAMAKALVDALGGDPSVVEGFGKGAIVGEAGEVEHGALWHAPGGYAMRGVLGNAKAIVPSTKKVGGPGTRLDVPVTHINASYVRGHFDAIEVGVTDAPRADEMALILVMTTGARVHDRAGGLAARDVKGEDGLR